MSIKSRFVIIPAGWILLMWFSGLNPVSAQTTTPEKKWNFLADVYLLLPNIDGETGLGNSLTIPIDASTGDIFSKLKMGAMLYLEARTDKWALTSDFVYMNLHQKVTPGKLIRSGAVTLKQSIWEAAGLYRITSFLEIGAGGRLNYLVTDIDAERNVLPSGSEKVTGHRSVTFYDPILITRFSADIMDKWLFQFRGDVGGFGIGSDFTWQLQGYAGYRFSRLFQLAAGYRIISIDYDKGADVKHFIFNVNEFGPVIRFGFYF